MKRVVLARAAALALLFGMTFFTATFFAATSAEAQRFRRPVACSDCIGNWFYFDQGGRSDYNCSNSTYNSHRGSDFSLIGGNAAINDGHDVVAVADGVVEFTLDGNFDHCMACGGPGCGTGFGYGFGNYVVINHGSHKTIYGHLRRGHLRVSMGDTVTCGDPIGQIASSGCSTGAHLHVETRPLGGRADTAFDPFEGPCSSIPSSLWVNQGPHRGLPGPMCEDGSGPMDPIPCPSGWYEIWTCNGDGRRRCIDGNRQTETCDNGCQGMPLGTDDVCACPAGWSETFTCHGDNQRRKCVAGETSVETCEYGCEPQAGGEDTCALPPVGDACPPGIDATWACNGEAERRRCIEGVVAIEVCPQGCVVFEGGEDECGAPEIPDNDGDGASGDIDCDDWDDARYPGAPETCGDGIDSDCDGSDCRPVGSDAGDGGLDGGVDGGLDGGSDAAWDSGGFDSDMRGGDLEGGCDCRTGRGNTSPLSLAFFVALFGLLSVRRRF